MTGVSCPFAPSVDRVVVRRDAPPEKVGKLHVPKTDKKPCTGRVVGKGQSSEKTEAAMREYAVGDAVCFAEYSGTEIDVADETYLVLYASDILGKMTGG